MYIFEVSKVDVLYNISVNIEIGRKRSCLINVK